MVEFDENGVPQSREFRDVYYSSEDGLAETRFVFLGSNRMEERLRNQARVCVGELGFGTGLNFLATWSLLRQTRSRARLVYFSVEKFPLPRADLVRALGRWDELAPERDLFLKEYPDLFPGFHHFIFESGQVELILAIGDVEEMLSELDSGDGIDAWYLDGFAPAKNPEMWRREIVEKVAHHSRAGSTFGTFTSVGQVRRDLESVGFRVEKVKGFAKKREMILGEFVPQNTHQRSRERSRKPQEVKIVGAGIAGTALADAFARRGVSVHLFEEEKDFAPRASGNPCAVIKPMLSTQPTAISELTLRGTGWLFRRIRALQEVIHSQCGALHIPESEDKATRFQRGLESHSLPSSIAERVDREEASLRSGVTCPSGGLWYHEAGWVVPAKLCHAYVSAYRDKIRTEFGHRVRPEELAGENWIWAGGIDVRELHPELNGHLRKVWGQLSSYPETSVSRSLRSVIHYGGYITPSHGGRHVVGSTHHREGAWDHDFEDFSPLISEDEEIFKKLSSSLPNLGFDLRSVQGRAALRVVVPDSLPLVGELTNSLAVSTAHGSRGMIYSSISAEILASIWTGEIVPIERRLVRKMSPFRFKRHPKNI